MKPEGPPGLILMTQKPGTAGESKNTKAALGLINLQLKVHFHVTVPGYGHVARENHIENPELAWGLRREVLFPQVPHICLMQGPHLLAETQGGKFRYRCLLFSPCLDQVIPCPHAVINLKAWVQGRGLHIEQDLKDRINMYLFLQGLAFAERGEMCVVQDERCYRLTPIDFHSFFF